MATSFPTGLDALTNPTGASSLTSPDHAGQHADANDAIEALEAKVGVNGSAVTTSLDYRVRNIDATTAIVNGNTSTDLVAITQAGTGIALDVIGSSTVSSQTNVSGVFGSAASGRLLLGSITGNTPFIGSEGATTLAFTTDSAIRMRIDSSGNVGIGGVPNAGRSFTLSKTMVGSTQPIGFFSSGQISTDATAGANYFNTFAATAASVATGTVTHYNTQQGTLGAGSSMVAQIGFNASDTLIGATLNYGFVGNIPSGANRFNLNMTGTAANFLAGRLGVGAILTSGAMAQIANTTAADKAFVVKGAGSQAGDFFDVQNSGGTSQLKFDSNGNLLVGATSRRSVGGGFQTGSAYSIFYEQAGLATGLTPFTCVLNRADGNGLRFILGKSRGTAAGGVTALVANDSIAEFHFAGADGSTLDPLAARIMVHVDGAVDTGSVPGRLSFATNPVAGTNPVERMRITSAGNVGIGTTAPAYLFDIHAGALGGTAGDEIISSRVWSTNANIDQILTKFRRIATGSTFVTAQAKIQRRTDGADQGYVGFGGGSDASVRLGSNVTDIAQFHPTFVSLEPSSYVAISTSTSERMRVDSTGNVGIGTTTPTSKLEVDGSATIDSQANVAAQFGTSGGTNNLLVGSITGNTPFVGSQGASALTFRTNNAERIRIDSDGNVGIGTASLTGISFRVGKIITGAINSYASIFQGTVQADVTSQAYGVYASLGTTGTPTTAPTLTLFAATQGTLAGTVTSNTQRGYFADSNLIGATNNYAFQGAIPSGTGRYNLYMSGTADNYLAGRLGVGATLTSGATTQITNPNASPADKVLVVKAAPSQSGSLLEAQNSSGTALVTINSAGKVGIGNTAPENTLDITGSFGRGNPAVKTANFTLAGTENWIICNGAGTITMTLPTPADCDGREFGIKTVSPQLVNSASANVIAIGGGAAGTAILPATSGAWAILVSDGSSWNIMCRGT